MLPAESDPRAARVQVEVWRRMGPEGRSRAAAAISESLVRPFSRAEFDRRRRAIVDGVEVWVAAAEDVLLAKLEWSKATGSERQLRDAAGIVAVQGEALDGEWLSRWAKELGVEAELARVWPGRDLP